MQSTHTRTYRVKTYMFQDIWYLGHQGVCLDPSWVFCKTYVCWEIRFPENWGVCLTMSCLCVRIGTGAFSQSRNLCYVCEWLHQYTGCRCDTGVDNSDEVMVCCSQLTLRDDASSGSSDNELRKRVMAVEEENQKLKNKALRTSRILAQSRKFMDTYIGKSQNMLQKTQESDQSDVEWVQWMLSPTRNLLLIITAIPKLEDTRLALSGASLPRGTARADVFCVWPCSNVELVCARCCVVGWEWELFESFDQVLFHYYFIPAGSELRPAASMVLSRWQCPNCSFS